MKKLLILLVLACTIGVASCTPEDQCGIVTGWDISSNGDYLVWIDGDKHKVNAGTWYEATIGEYMCVEY